MVPFSRTFSSWRISRVGKSERLRPSRCSSLTRQFEVPPIEIRSLPDTRRLGAPSPKMLAAKPGSSKGSSRFTSPPDGRPRVSSDGSPLRLFMASAGQSWPNRTAIISAA